MKKNILSTLAVCLCLCMLLSGCMGVNFLGYFGNLMDLLGGSLTTFDQMEYTRPDMEQFRTVLEDCCADAQTETDLDKLVDVIYTFYEAYDDYYTNAALAMIHYSKDQTDTAWETEYNFCTENSAEVDAGLDRFYRVLAKSSLRPELESDDYFGAGFFAPYEGESLYDDYFTDLLNQEAVLENEYYSLIAQAGADFAYTQSFYDTWGCQMAEIFVELIRVRQLQADYAGYESYPEFAYDFYHLRDYTVQDATAYLADIRAELAPLYQQALTGMDIVLEPCTEQEMYEYVANTAATMDDNILYAFEEMVDAGLYDITYSENKLDASFEIFIRNFYSPYVFVNPTGTEYDKLTFIHEFGHFCNDYMSWGSGVGVDVAEIFSQGMEYLSLCYGEADENLIRLKLLDSLCIYVEQAAYASFEQQVYGLEGENLTVETVQALYDTVCQGYGLEGSWTYVFITHFFTEPLYVISYVVSNDAALQLYQMEQEETGAGLTCLEENLATMEPYFLAFLEEAGLESPFATGRIQRVKETLQSVLNG